VPVVRVKVRGGAGVPRRSVPDSELGRERLDPPDAVVDGRLRQRRVGELAQFPQAHLGMLEPQVREFTQGPRQLVQPARFDEQADVSDLRHGGVRGLLQVGRLGVHETVHVVAHRLDDPDVLRAQQRAVRAHEREEGHDGLGALEIDGEQPAPACDARLDPEAVHETHQVTSQLFRLRSELEMEVAVRVGHEPAAEERAAQV
jgi:hypothetical protein